MQLVLILALLLKVVATSFPDNCSDVMVIHFPEDGSIIERHQSLTNISSIPNNTEIWICSEEVLYLEGVVDIDGVSNISIIGYSDPVIRCKDQRDAGLRFSDIQGLVISNITIENCAATSTFDQELVRNIRASINIQRSSDVTISGISVLNGPGTGLALFDIDGTLDVADSNFEGNGVDLSSGGNGVYLEVSESSRVQSSPLAYTFVCCRFINNTARTGKDSKISGFTRFDKGGGMAIFVRSHDGVKINIENSTISGNEAASYGGGVLATFNNNARNSRITVKGSNYTQNRARYGGGHYAGYLHSRYRGQTPLNCSHVFLSNSFSENYANYGGGVSVFSTKTRVRNPNGTVSFENCMWWRNSGQFGSAIAILPNAWNLNTDGYLPTVYFSNNTIDSNHVMDDLDNESTLIRQYTKGSGALFCTDHTLEFSNHNSFLRNNGSAFYMGTCIARLSEHSETHFSFNSGYNGGAVYQIASVLYFSENVVMVFESNAAYGRGGAIYQTDYNFHMYDYSRSCFLSYRGVLAPPERNITIKFIDNSAGTGYGHSIYTYSLLPCYRLFTFAISNITPKIFDQVGNVTFYPQDRDKEIATASSHAHTNAQDKLFIPALPGERILLPYTDSDDLGQETKSVYLVTVKGSGNSSTRVDEAYMYISNNQVVLYGRSENQAELMLSSYQSRQRSILLNVSLLPCPPGFKLANESQHSSSECRCAYGTESEYRGIVHCNMAIWRAYRRRGYWVGYMDGQAENEDSLVTGYCPVSFCSHEDGLLLPATSDTEDLNSMICDSRVGTLCGKCATNHSVYYHSLHFTCRPDQYCKLGWLFYILSELFPVTIIFLIIIMFNITFTSGKVNGFIFFVQVVVTFHVSADDFIPLPSGVLILNRILHFIFLTFNLNPFTLDEMSFCLFESATAPDVIVFSYITLVYSLVLVIGVILLMNKLNMRYYCKPLRKCIGPQWQTLQGSVIHGLSAFLVLCYAKCTQASIFLLTYAGIHVKGGETGKLVLFYNGEITWFSVQHLPYAIPAIIMALVFVISPPLILLIYPVHYRILSALKISESKCVNIILHPLDKLKPLLDSFQGSFKDEYRFFSGLYFVYRFSILAGVYLSPFQDTYFVILALLLFMILLHALCQPYKERLHNVIDTLLFVNLAVINGITMYNLSNVESNIKSYTTTATLGYIQTFLIALPLLVVVLCLMKKIFCHLKFLCAKKTKKMEESITIVEDDEELPARMLYDMDDLDESTTVYQAMK